METDQLGNDTTEGGDTSSSPLDNEKMADDTNSCDLSTEDTGQDSSQGMASA